MENENQIQPGSDLELIRVLPSGIETTAKVLKSEFRFKDGQKFGAVPEAGIPGYAPKRLGEVLENLQEELKKDPNFAKNEQSAENFLDSNAVISLDHLSLAVLDAAKALAGDSVRVAGGYYWKEAENLRSSLAAKYAEVPKAALTKVNVHKLHLNVPTRVSLGLASLALSIQACGTAIVNPSLDPSPNNSFPTETTPDSLITPIAENKSEITVNMSPIKDKNELMPLVKDFSEGTILYYDDSEPGVYKIENKIGFESGFTLVGAVEVNGQDTEGQEVKFGILGYVIGNGGTEHVAQRVKFEDGSYRWIVLTFSKELAGENLGAFGYFDTSKTFIPVVSAEVDSEGQFTGKKWFYDQDTAQFYQIQVATGGGVLSILAVGNMAILEGQNVMKDSADTDWNFAWSEEGNLQIVSGSGEILFTSFDEESNQWIKKEVEKDLNPAYTETVSQEFMGVQINAELITDESVKENISKVTVPEKVYTEFIARTIFKVWWKKGEVAHAGPVAEDDFKAFMNLWADAQKSGLEEDWRKVQINDLWANDLNDGNGYIQEKYTIWPMFEGESPEMVRGINNMAFVLVKSDSVTNLDIKNEYGLGFGTNLDERLLYVYMGSYSWVSNDIQLATIYVMNDAVQWLYKNTGNGVDVHFSLDKPLEKLLKNGGLRVYP